VYAVAKNEALICKEQNRKYQPCCKREMSWEEEKTTAEPSCATERSPPAPVHLVLVMNESCDESMLLHCL